MSDAERFSKPISKNRPRGARRIEAFSPKLGRRVKLYSSQAFELWLNAEADPSVPAFCERPVVLTVEGRERTIIDILIR